MAENVCTEERWRTENNWETVQKDLEEKGYAVLSSVLTDGECNQCIAQYREWLSQFDEDEAPFQFRSIIQGYRIGHFEPSWRVRLKSKPVFAKLWNTDKLLSSFDGVAIAEPPELSGESFTNADDVWLHMDQGDYRQGLHAYQGAVYLEETTKTDWVFRVLEGSHKHHKTFCEGHPEGPNRGLDDFYELNIDEIDWFKSLGCPLRKVPVPKGGMVLWDSRLIHDSQRPQLGRPHADRWRFVVFVSMTPAIWASKRDLDLRKTAYKQMFMTTHWSSQGGNFCLENFSDFPWKSMQMIERLPTVAKSDQAKYLSGVLKYDFADGQPNGDEFCPVWTIGEYAVEPQ